MCSAWSAISKERDGCTIRLKRPRSREPVKNYFPRQEKGAEFPSSYRYHGVAIRIVITLHVYERQSVICFTHSSTDEPYLHVCDFV